jgi:hypothetical protein
VRGADTLFAYLNTGAIMSKIHKTSVTKADTIDTEIEPANFSAVRPTARAVADQYLKQFHPGARASRDPIALDTQPMPGITHRFDFTTASGSSRSIYLGEAAGGGWQVKARQRTAIAAAA